jgi:hypothetical protein
MMAFNRRKETKSGHKKAPLGIWGCEAARESSLAARKGLKTPKPTTCRALSIIGDRRPEHWGVGTLRVACRGQCAGRDERERGRQTVNGIHRMKADYRA